ncbi:type II toxin-antitoxin system Phd/YefM family antitoxin [Acidaminococcus timonensis]|uniref:type II toxin-antitoxin system Phd/YefM family antitoxin n=1 Tax=Acidaminococcus timonensis TaxID=1871002 RepID=UPI0026F135CF|nr:type II toxin-antitoxin system prevent-host-death family antitoxin [Acidaminococcus timonensis]
MAQQNKEEWEAIFMLKVNESTFRKHLKEYLDQAVDHQETIMVTRDHKEAVVTMSLQQYNNLMENLFIVSDRTNYEHILEGVRQLENREVMVVK